MKFAEIKSSHFKSSITVQKCEQGPDEYGIVQKDWVLKYSKRAHIQGLSYSYKKREMLQAQGVNSYEVKEVVIRYCDINARDRILYKGQPYKIISIEDLEEKNKYLLVTMERLNG